MSAGDLSRERLGIVFGEAMRLFLVLLALVLGGIAATNYYISQHPHAITYRTDKVVVTDITEVVAVTGYAEPIEVRNVQAEIPGVIEKVLVDFNDNVKKDQPLAVLTGDLQKQQLKQAEALLKKAEAAVAVAESERGRANAGLSLAEATVNMARQQMERAKSLATSGTVERVKEEEAETNFKRANAGAAEAQSNINKANAGKMVAEADRKSAQNAVDAANMILEKTLLKSNMDGVILNKNIRVGDTVPKPQVSLMDEPSALFTLSAPLNRMQAIVKVNEADYSRVKEGQKAVFSVDAYPTVKFEARVKQIRNAPTSDRTAVSYATVLEFENRKDRWSNEWMVKPRSTVSADIQIKSIEKVVAIPNAALLFTPSDSNIKLPELKERQAVIWRVGKDKKPEYLIVERGISNEKYTHMAATVAGGELKEGDELITSEPPPEKSKFSLPVGN